MGSPKSKLLPEASKYSVVGLIGYAVDVSLFNAISLVTRNFLDYEQPYLPKVIATSIAVWVTYVFNSRWTFSARTGNPAGAGRITRYALVNLVGLSIGLLCLAFSRYVLGLDSLLADNISANVVGVGLAWIFRFFANRKWVFLA